MTRVPRRGPARGAGAVVVLAAVLFAGCAERFDAAPWRGEAVAVFGLNMTATSEGAFVLVRLERVEGPPPGPFKAPNGELVTGFAVQGFLQAAGQDNVAQGAAVLGWGVSGGFLAVGHPGNVTSGLFVADEVARWWEADFTNGTWTEKDFTPPDLRFAGPEGAADWFSDMLDGPRVRPLPTVGGRAETRVSLGTVEAAGGERGG